ncbi:MAG: MtnX-like HAD-IB family phosphatase, partial [Candidatus Krumholzibacteria bacterium]|nr:MtnX-like HAD-IB family phosphatase [Candidatus Krumholzibacteria bacterium]
MSRKIAIICDFDGTISVRDVGHHFFGTFIHDHGRRRELLHRWKIGLISSRECLEREIAWVKATRNDLDDFIGSEKLDPYIKDFVDFCNRRKFEIMILSDGLDYYIDRLLMKFGIGFLDFKANHLMMSDGSITGVDFPYYNTMECTMCGNCKRYHLERFKEQDYYSVYVGNGYSDRCPAEHADMVLAKDDLLDHFRREGLDC